MAARRLKRTLTAALATVASAALVSCDDRSAPEGFALATIGGRTFTLEIAADEATRQKGLAFRETIPDDGGMVFTFRDAQVRSFVMRDCLAPIDIIFLDPTGRVTATHHMPIDPRQPGEADNAYERRLKPYSSRFACQFVVELRGGMLEEVPLKPGDRVGLDLEALKAAAR